MKKQIPKEKRYFSKELATMSREDMNKLQFEKTKDILKIAYHQSEFYRNLFDRAKVKPEDFKTLEDIARFPYIEKQDLIKDQSENPPFGSMICAPFEEIRRVNLTSGTSGMGQEVHCHDEEAIRAANVSTAAHFAAIGLDRRFILARKPVRSLLRAGLNPISAKLFCNCSQVAFMPYEVGLTDERPTSNIERPTSNEKINI
jgi:phenylacetate-coenzyme A ligase PaaK-like adenylate-forming protein